MILKYEHEVSAVIHDSFAVPFAFWVERGVVDAADFAPLDHLFHCLFSRQADLTGSYFLDSLALDLKILTYACARDIVGGCLRGVSSRACS